jgi:hypothetical protein
VIGRIVHQRPHRFDRLPWAVLVDEHVPAQRLRVGVVGRVPQELVEGDERSGAAARALGGVGHASTARAANRARVVEGERLHEAREHVWSMNPLREKWMRWLLARTVCDMH